jgi:hypothetical protein
LIKLCFYDEITAILALITFSPNRLLTYHSFKRFFYFFGSFVQQKAQRSNFSGITCTAKFCLAAKARIAALPITNCVLY